MSAENNGTAISTVTAQDVPVVSPQQLVSFDPTQPARVSWYSMDPKTEDGMMLLMLMRHGDCHHLSEQVGQVLHVKNVLIEPRESTDEQTGEVKYYPRIVLHCDDDRLYSCGSHGVFASLVDLIRFRPQMPWSPPMPVKVVQKSIGHGRKYMVLLYAPNVVREQKKGGK